MNPMSSELVMTDGRAEAYNPYFISRILILFHGKLSKKVIFYHYTVN